MTIADHVPAQRPAAASTSYRAVLGSRHVARLLGGTLVGRLPNGMAPVAIVLLITSQGASLAAAGLLSALYGLAASLSQPIKGRLMDRHGQMPVSGPGAVLNSVCLLLLLPIGADSAAATGVVVLAGLCSPPLEAGLRALWPTVLPDHGQRRVALALDTGSQGLLYIAGPLLVAALATAYGPQAAITASAVLGLAGTTVVLTAPPSRAWRPQHAAGSGPARLHSTALSLVFLAHAGFGLALGAMNVWAVAMAERHDMELLSGLIPGAFATGSFLGGLLYARRACLGSPTVQLRTAAAGFCIGWLPLLALPGPLTATVMVTVPGVFLTVVIACGFTTADALVQTRRRTEAYAWLIASVGVGQAVGTALAGALATHHLTAAALPAAGATLALVVLVAARHHLTATASTAATEPTVPAPPLLSRKETPHPWLSVRPGPSTTPAATRPTTISPTDLPTSAPDTHVG
ncbi:MFS transporter [Streptomyces phyllanthi]|uniref:MFS transporter n=1 Tax=Streptomyces phyllanthi TaxID=1803180 RepID=A0A5N8WE98_9ACTN|nr:MFS transporter [Streptomyces phyllanthi]MPY44495.1 MFS transporter [Streptomyces phyllanthi]